MVMIMMMVQPIMRTLQTRILCFRRERRSPNLVLEIDSKTIVEQTSGTTHRLAMSARKTAMMLATVVKSGGGNLSEVPVSKKAVTDRGRRQEPGKERNSGIPLLILTLGLSFIMTQHLSTQKEETQNAGQLYFTVVVFISNHTSWEFLSSCLVLERMLRWAS